MHPLAELRTTDRGARRLLESMIERYPGNDLLAAREEPDPPFRPIALESIAAPALVVSGEFDLKSRLNAAIRLARRLPRSERTVIPDAAHLPNLDNPEAYNRLVSAFIQRHTTAST
jgi:pimeloyl-ACP methyl ester carboxylesterase